jgi:hypothetical protein
MEKMLNRALLIKFGGHPITNLSELVPVFDCLEEREAYFMLKYQKFHQELIPNLGELKNLNIFKGHHIDKVREFIPFIKCS